MKPGTAFNETYLTGGQVGRDEGLIGVTCLANEIHYIARQIEKRDMPIKSMQSVEDYLKMLAGVDHAHMCRFIEAFDLDERLQLIYEKASDATLFDSEGLSEGGKPMDHESVQGYCRQIAMAFSVAHKAGIVHGHLQESHLLLDPQEVDGKSIKICDMGQTHILRKSCSGNTPQCQAPEAFWDDFPASDKLVTMKQHLKTYMNGDMWAFGVLLYKMLTARMPFHGLASRDCSVEFGSEWSEMPEAREVVHGLLKINGSIRLTAEKVLKHSWVQLSKERVSRAKMMRVLQNVAFNTRESMFKKFALRVIAEDMSDEKLEIVQKAFRFIDRNCDGTLELEEIRSALKRYGEADSEADAIFNAIDRDASGTLNFAEFGAMSIGPSEYCDKEVLWHTFNRFDRDANGAFDQSEITTILREIQHLSESEQVTNEVNEIAGDIEMPVDFDTFVHIMRTPVGQNINKLKLGWDKMCHSVLKIDNHNVRHLAPRTYDVMSSPLMKSPYSVSSSLSANKSSTKR